MKSMLGQKPLKMKMVIIDTVVDGCFE